MLPAELGLGAGAGLRSLQPQECNTHLLPWQSRHCQTGRMCEGAEDRGVVEAETGVRVCVRACTRAMDAWEMTAERMTVRFSVISWRLIHWPPCLVVRRLNTHRHTFKHTPCHLLPTQ